MSWCSDSQSVGWGPGVRDKFKIRREVNKDKEIADALMLTFISLNFNLGKLSLLIIDKNGEVWPTD